jgi:hypothetical protein
VIDITDELATARGRSGWSLESMDRVPAAAGDDELRVEWEDGDDWLRLLHASTVLALVWAVGPLVVTTAGHVDLVDAVERVVGVRPEVVVVPNFHAPVLRLDPNRLREIWPDRGFPVEAVDVEGGMTALDLWYAMT